VSYFVGGGAVFAFAVHDAAPTDDVVPAAHAVHETDPADEYVFAAHAMHDAVPGTLA
jgi:hypothetical protein